MGTVGINFGSATGGAGFDVTATVSSILAIESGVEAPWKAQITTLQAQDTALTGLGTNLSALSSALGSLTSFDGVFAGKLGASSNANVLSLTSATSSAVAGSHTVVVSTLAQTSSQYSDAVASDGTILSGSLVLQVGSGQSGTITLDTTNNTLATLARAINAGNQGVSASVITDNTGSRLSLVSGVGGSAGNLSITSSLHAAAGPTVQFQTGQTGLDAQFTVDGVPVTSGTNAVTGAIPGVTFQLLAASPGTALQVQITNDTGSVTAAVKNLVTAYNASVDAIAAQEGKDASGKAQPLYGDPNLAYLQAGLASGLQGASASGDIRSIGALGLTIGTDGKLSMDGTVFSNLLNAKFSDVNGYFQNKDSFGQSLTTTLNALGSNPGQGILGLALAQNTSQETDLRSSVTREDARVAEEKIRLTAELTTADQILQSIPAQLSEVDQIYSALTGYNTKAG